ncbi:MAG TPA: APC family permease [Terriglobia bacterium]|nr:APC family permease [Terriglobia bacterium]
MNEPSRQSFSPESRAVGLPQVVVASTAMLTFISLWRAAAIVLNDLGSSAFYAGGIAERALGKSAPWYILAVMLFAYAVAQMYVESCSMFVRGGVYRVVKEAMGGTLAKFSVSALMFDYILTGPISGVAAGQYLTGFLNEILDYLHVNVHLPANATSAAFAALVTLYFWWQNTKGIEESSEKAVLIMRFTTVLVVLMIVWSGYTLWVRGGELPPSPRPANLHFSPEAEGWLLSSHLPEIIGVIGILVAFGHSILAMSGLETLAQVYREIQHPKLPNLKKAALVIFVYSLLFTSLVSFFAVMIIPDATRSNFFDNLIGGLAMNVVGPYWLRMAFHAFVVLVGIMILSGAVNTALVGSNGVLNRVSEDGVLTSWFRRPHPRFGTSYRILNLVVALQLLTILLSRGDVLLLGAAYAFGVIWSFAMKGIAVVVLRFTKPGPREFRVPVNPRLGRLEIPLGLGLMTLTLLAVALVNLLTKEIATVAGVSFTLVFFGIFTLSERFARKGGQPHQELDQFHLNPSEELSPETVGCRPGGILVLARDYNTLYHLDAVLSRVNTARRDVVVCHIRVLRRAGSGEHLLEPDQLFSVNDQMLFTHALAVAEKRGKPIRLTVVAASQIWDGILRTARNLQTSAIVLGQSAKMPATEEARRGGLAWERLQEPRPHISLEIFTSGGQHQIFYLGPHVPHLTQREIDLLHKIWLRFSSELGEQELHHHDIVHFALMEIEREIAAGGDAELLQRLKAHLQKIDSQRLQSH